MHTHKVKRGITTAIICAMMPVLASAKCGGVNYSLGADALATMHDYLVTLMLYVTYIVCAFGAILSIISATQIYFKFNLGEEGITKNILILVGAILFIIGAFKVFPAFFGYQI